jgi:hypothetical protein
LKEIEVKAGEIIAKLASGDVSEVITEATKAITGLKADKEKAETAYNTLETRVDTIQASLDAYFTREEPLTDKDN